GRQAGLLRVDRRRSLGCERGDARRQPRCRPLLRLAERGIPRLKRRRRTGRPAAIGRPDRAGLRSLHPFSASEVSGVPAISDELVARTTATSSEDDAEPAARQPCSRAGGESWSATRCWPSHAVSWRCARTPKRREMVSASLTVRVLSVCPRQRWTTAATIDTA